MGKKPRTKEENTFAPLVAVLAASLMLLQLIMYPLMADVYALPKATFLSVATLLLLFLYFRYAVAAQRFTVYRSPLDTIVLLYLAAVTISLLISDQPLLGLVGKYKRYEGLPALFSFAVVYFIAAQTIRDEKSLEWLLKILAVGLIPVVLYGFAQAAGYDFPGVLLFERRVQSSLGNPILLGTYLVVMLPLLFGLGRNSSQPNWRTLAWLLMPALFANILLTESRGAWVGLGASMVALFVLGRPPSTAHAKKKRRDRAEQGRRIRGIYIIVGVLIVSIALFALLPTDNLEKRFVSTFAFSEGSVSTRIEIWKASLSMVADRPLTGFGLEQMGYWFPLFKTERHSKIAPSAVTDRTHNDFLQTAVDSGLPGLLFFLWMIIAVALSLYCGRRATPYAAALFAALTGYFAQAQTGIPAVFMTPLIWMLLAVAMNLSGQSRATKVKLPAWLRSPASAYAVGAVCAALALASFLPVVADLRIYKGQQAAWESFEMVAPEMAAPDIESALRLYPYQTAYSKIASEFYLDYAVYAGNDVFAQRAVLIAEQGLAFNERDFELTYYAGEASLLSYRFKENPLSLARAQDYFEMTEKLWPQLNFIDSKLLEVAVLKGDNEKALAKAREMVAEGQEDVRAYYVLLAEARRLDDSEQVTKYLKLIEKMQPGVLERTEGR
ncbi:MAG: O-antigen ligase family protein [Candidatus Aquicultor sp.]|nr:O-antigen ligase family protein [Candidatus Aquicultor sp.]